MKIELEISDKNEGTRAPWWMIVDPRQNFLVNEDGVHHIASMITGPFCSREEAEEMLRLRRHHYSQNARVYCASGCYTMQYDRAVKIGGATK